MNIALEKMPATEANALPGLSNLEGVVRASEPKSILMLEAAYVLQMIERLHQADALAAAAIQLAWSESGTEAMLRGHFSASVLYEAWEEMDALVAAIDPMRPGWRVEGEPND